MRLLIVATAMAAFAAGAFASPSKTQTSSAAPEPTMVPAIQARGRLWCKQGWYLEPAKCFRKQYKRADAPGEEGLLLHVRQDPGGGGDPSPTDQTPTSDMPVEPGYETEAPMGGDPSGSEATALPRRA